MSWKDIPFETMLLFGFPRYFFVPALGQVEGIMICTDAQKIAGRVRKNGQFAPVIPNLCRMTDGTEIGLLPWATVHVHIEFGPIEDSSVDIFINGTALNRVEFQ